LKIISLLVENRSECRLLVFNQVFWYSDGYLLQTNYDNKQKNKWLLINFFFFPLVNLTLKFFFFLNKKKFQSKMISNWWKMNYCSKISGENSNVEFIFFTVKFIVTTFVYVSFLHFAFYCITLEQGFLTCGFCRIRQN